LVKLKGLVINKLCDLGIFWFCIKKQIKISLCTVTL